MIFALRENAVFGQFESDTGALPGVGGIQHLTRRLGRTRAIEAGFGVGTATEYRYVAEAGIRCWAGTAYQGPGGTVRARWERLSAGRRDVNVSHAKIRALGEQAMATLKTWRLPRKIRCPTTRVAALVQAVLTLRLTSSS